MDDRPHAAHPISTVAERRTEADADKRAETAATATRAAERRLEDVIRLSSDWIWETDAEDRLSYVSGRAIDLLGLPPEALLGRRIAELGRFEDESGEKSGDGGDPIAARRPFRDRPWTAENAEGGERRLLISALPFYHPSSGAFGGMRGTAKDVTDQFTADQALKQSEERYRTLVELSPNATLVVQKGLISYANSAAAKLLGASSPDDLIGRQSLDFVDADDRKMAKAQGDQATGDNFFLPPVEMRHRRLDGSTVHTAAASAGITWLGVPALLVTFRDIDELKKSEIALAESEQRFRDFAQSTADRFWETDENHRFTYFSTPAVQRIYRDDEILGHARWELPGHTADPDSVAALKRLMEDHVPFKDQPQVLRTPDGRLAYYRVSGVPVFAPDGTFRGYRGTTVDETAERTARAQASDIQRQFFEAMETISEGFAMWGPDGRFVYCNSHFRESHAAAGEVLTAGHSYAEFIDALAETGERPESVGRQRDWARDRLREFASGESRHQERTADGWVEVRKERLPDGSTIVVFNDVTDAREREEALSESESRFKDFAEAASSRLWETDENHRFTMAITGEHNYLTARSEMIGKARWERAGADPDPELWARHRAVLEAHEPFRDFQYRQTDSLGRTRYLRANGTPFFDADGTFKGYRGTAIDVTAEVTAEKALRESETRLRQITDAAPAYIAYFDTDLRYRFANRHYTELGLDPDAMVGRTMAEMMGADVMEHARPYLDRALAGEPADYEVQIETRNGPITAHVHLTPEIGPGGAVDGLFLMGVDITDRKEWEEALQRSKAGLDSAQRIAHMGSFDRNFDGSDLTWSDELYRIFGLDPEGEQIRFETFLRMLHPDDRAPLIAEFEALARDHAPTFSLDFRIIRRDGTERIIRNAGQITYDVRGHPLRASGTAQDVTERVRAEEALEKTRREAELANRAKSEFLSSMSHELRTPMNAILGYAQLLLQNRKQPLSELQTRQVNQILRGGQHLLQLINDILDLAKIESGRLALSLEDVDPRGVIDECVELMRTLGEAHRVEIRDATEGREIPWIRADMTRFKQALLNLMSNAIKYNRPDGLVTVSARLTEPGTLRVMVADTGPGIPEDRQRELFEPFSRLGAEERGIEGTGIGLLITKQLVELMDGAIDYASRPGEGSQFWIDLPCVAKEARAQGGARRSLKMAPAEADPDAAPRTVLYVEDDASNLALMKEVVSQLPNVRLLSATTAEDGIEVACADDPDLVIMDINLPGMNGLEALGELRRRTGKADVPVIALTAAARLEDIRKGQLAGFDRYLTKPFKVDDLLVVVDKFLYPGRRHG